MLFLFPGLRWYLHNNQGSRFHCAALSSLADSFHFVTKMTAPAPTLTSAFQFAGHVFSYKVLSLEVVHASKFQFKMFLVSFVLLSLWTHGLFSNELFNSQIFKIIILLPISNLVLVLSNNTFCMISVLLNLPRIVSWFSIQSVLVNVPWALEKNVNFAIVGKMFYKYYLGQFD